MFRNHFIVAGLASLLLAQPASVAAPGTATDTITISEDAEVYTELILEGNGAANNWKVSSNIFSTAGFGSFGEFTISEGMGGVAIAIWPGAGATGIVPFSMNSDSRIEMGTAPISFPATTGTPLTLTDSITGNNSPNIHFNTGAGVWELWGKSDGMGITDGVSGNGGIPFVIRPGAPNDAFAIDSSGFIGMGTQTPSANLHVKVDDGAFNLPFIVENTNGINFSGFRLQIGPGNFIDFNNSAGNFRINSDQMPGAEFEVRPSGDATLSGALTQNSDVNSKQDIVGVDLHGVLVKVMGLPITEWSYKDTPASRHIGPMAQDFYKSFGLGYTDKGITSIDTGGVALAAIQGLKQEKDAEIARLAKLATEKDARIEKFAAEKDTQIANLQARLKQQEERMIQLELALTEVLRNQSSEVQVSLAN